MKRTDILYTHIFFVHTHCYLEYFKVVFIIIILFQLILLANYRLMPDYFIIINKEGENHIPYHSLLL